MELRNDKGQAVRLLRPLTRAGGEGQVFEIERSTMVAKVYHQPADPQKATKLRYQVQLAKPELRSIAAWPTELLLDPQNPTVVRGIIMPRMAGKEVHELYGVASRTAIFPDAGWDFLIHVAMNCAAVFETLHEHDVLMADVNEGNLLVKERDGQVGLIDCDSYQIRNGSGYFLCGVGIPMWTPPELQGRSFVNLQRTANHDRFGLAVIIFRLLFMGRHPFAGIPTGRDQIEIEEAIRRYLFAFASQTWSKGVKPPPLSLPLGAIPQRISRLFERAFLQGSEVPSARPTGREWFNELKVFLSALKKGCMDPGHKYWNGLTACPWCEIVNAGGPNFFISVSVNLGSGSWAADCASFWATIERARRGALMNERVVMPAIGKATPRPMPLGRPQAPSVSAPVAPARPAPLPRPIITPPQFPPRPVKRRPAPSPRVPLGPNERIARLSGLGTLFFAAFAGLGAVLELEAAKYGSMWALITCVVLLVLKAGKGRQEQESRKVVEQKAREEAKRVVEEEHKKQIEEFGKKVEELTKQHAAAVAHADAAYQQEWSKRDQEYQKIHNAYLAEQRVYDAAQARYVEEVGLWNAEVDVRSGNEEQARRGLNVAVGELETVYDAYRTAVNGAVPPLEAAKQRSDQAGRDEAADMAELRRRLQELQLQQFLAMQVIQNADIPNIGSGRKATLNAYSIDSALHIHSGMRVPGFGAALINNLIAWRRLCEGRFRYNPNAGLPTADVNRVRMKHAKTRQSALTDLRAGAAKLEALEARTRPAVDQKKMQMLVLARAHMQAIADLTVCK